MSNVPLIALRVAFLFFSATLGIFIINSQQKLTNAGQLLSLAVVIGIAMVVIALDMTLRTKRLDTISAVYFGLIVGLFLTYVAGFLLSPFLDLIERDDPAKPWHTIVTLVVGMVLCYTCVSLLLQTRNDFRFIIPYVEFAKEVKGIKPLVLDTSVVIDGRIADVVQAGLMDGQLIMPRFALSELQAIADSSDRLRRSRGRRGLDVLNQLRAASSVDLQIYDRELPEFSGQPVDLKLVLLAKHLEGKIVTNDFNLNKVAKLHGVGVINLNEVANALKPIFLPGEQFDVSVIKPGEEAGQGIGYLDDGTMVVVENGRDHVGHVVHILVTSVLQTSAGRMVFGKFERLANNK